MTKSKQPQHTHRSDAHRALAERESVIVEAHAAAGFDAQVAAIAEDRAARWATLLAGREESAEIRAWAAQMAILFGRQTVKVWRTHVPWVAALYVVRYGEAEDFWPAQLGSDDLRKAHRWLRGETPRGVSYVREEK